MSHTAEEPIDAVSQIVGAGGALLLDNRGRVEAIVRADDYDRPYDPRELLYERVYSAEPLA